MSGRLSAEELEEIADYYEYAGSWSWPMRMISHIDALTTENAQLNERVAAADRLLEMIDSYGWDQDDVPDPIWGAIEIYRATKPETDG